MGKLFKLALEEAVAEEPSIVENVPVEEAVQNAEELAKTDSEIQQDIAAVEELMEEKAKLEDQAVTNDELLSNPDAVVTATDVEVSEETRTEVQYSLGYTSNMGKIRLSQESVFNDVKSNPRKYLAISNEDIKDTIKKIWEKIKAFFRKIWDKVKTAINALKFKAKRVTDKLRKSANNLKNKQQNDNEPVVSTEERPVVGIESSSDNKPLSAFDFQKVVSQIPILAIGMCVCDSKDVYGLVNERGLGNELKDAGKYYNKLLDAFNEFIKNDDVDNFRKKVYGAQKEYYSKLWQYEAELSVRNIWKKAYRYFDVVAKDKENDTKINFEDMVGRGELVVNDMNYETYLHGAIGSEAHPMRIYLSKLSDSLGCFITSSKIECVVNLNKLNTQLYLDLTLGKVKDIVKTAANLADESAYSTYGQVISEMNDRINKLGVHEMAYKAYSNVLDVNKFCKKVLQEITSAFDKFKSVQSLTLGSRVALSGIADKIEQF